MIPTWTIVAIVCLSAATLVFACWVFCAPTVPRRERRRRNLP